MTDVMRFISPPAFRPTDNVVIHSFSEEAAGYEVLELMGVSFASAAWTANRLIMVPFSIAQRTKVDGFFWYNGTVVNGSTDVGIYSETGQTKFGSSGATTNTGTSVLQDVNVTDFYLPGRQRYWLVLGSDSATQTYFRQAATALLQEFIGIKEQLSGWSSGLPTTLTLGNPTVAVYPFFGFRGVSVI